MLIAIIVIKAMTAVKAILRQNYKQNKKEIKQQRDYCKRLVAMVLLHNDNKTLIRKIVIQLSINKFNSNDNKNKSIIDRKDDKK